MRKCISLLLMMLSISVWAQQPRAEYPRPQFERQDWVNLNGEWSYTFDFVGSGMEKRLYESKGFDGKIIVPFCPESKLSGVGYTDFINNIWYQRSITVPAAWAGRSVMLNFGAVYYNAEIFIDGQLAGRHFGGSTSFAVDVTRFVSDGKAHSLVVHAYSDTRTGKQPAGKQNMRLTQFECMYTRCTGIWQTVWMEPVDKNALQRTQVITDIDQKQVIVHPTFYAQEAATLTATLKDAGKVVATQTVQAQNSSTVVLPVKNPKLW
ncbi:MAG: beta-glucuronidase, partial [Bacteroidaceae bacterium]|nr:beta-glucuronidase [Bacteroidaceae bacterium]